MANQTFAFQQTTERQYPFGYAAHPENFSLYAQAITMDQILPAAGLDWTMREEDLFRPNGVKSKYSKSIIREDTEEELATVGSDYVLTQHKESLAIIEDFLGENATFAGGGCFKGGRSVWLQAHMTEGYKLLDDEMEDFLVIRDTHDGSGSFTIYITPIRIWCKNCLNPSLRKAKRKFMMRHTRNVLSRIEEAREVLFHASEYRVELASFAEHMVNQRVSDAQVKIILNSLFPSNEKSTDLVKRNAEEKKEAFYICYAAPDIAKFQGTAWGVLNAVSDLVCHSLPHRNTQTYDEQNWSRIMGGHPLFDQTVRFLA